MTRKNKKLMVTFTPRILAETSTHRVVEASKGCAVLERREQDAAGEARWESRYLLGQIPEDQAMLFELLQDARYRVTGVTAFGVRLDSTPPSVSTPEFYWNGSSLNDSVPFWALLAVALLAYAAGLFGGLAGQL